MKTLLTFGPLGCLPFEWCDMARKMRAKSAQMLAMNREDMPCGQSTFTAALKSTTQTNHMVRTREKLPWEWARLML